VSRIADWIHQQKQVNEADEARITVRLEASQHEALKSVAEAIGMSKTACATQLLAEAIQDALMALKSGAEKVATTDKSNSDNCSHVTTYAHMKGRSTMSHLFEQVKTALQFSNDVEMHKTMSYFGFWNNGKVFAYVHTKKSYIRIDVKPQLPLQPGLVEPARNTAKVCKRSIFIKTVADLETILPLLKECFTATHNNHFQ